MLSNLEQHFSSENLLHEIQHDNDDSSSSSDSDDGFQTLDANGMPEPPANPWSPEEDEVLRATAEVMEPKNWPSIAESLPGRTARECKRRWGHLQRNGEGKIRTPWSKEEDDMLKDLVAQHGSKAWKMISSLMPGRKSKQCRERWTNVVDPKLNYAPWTEEEEQILILAQQELGNKWSQIEKRLPGRSANSIKNYWYSALRRGERKRAKIERKAAQPEGKKRRPRKPKSTEGTVEGGESEPFFVTMEQLQEAAASESDFEALKPKKKAAGKRKKKDMSGEEGEEVGNEHGLFVDDAGAVADDEEKPAKGKAGKRKTAGSGGLTEEEKLLKPVGKKRRKQIAIVEETLDVPEST